MGCCLSVSKVEAINFIAMHAMYVPASEITQEICRWLWPYYHRTFVLTTGLINFSPLLHKFGEGSDFEPHAKIHRYLKWENNCDAHEISKKISYKIFFSSKNNKFQNKWENQTFDTKFLYRDCFLSHLITYTCYVAFTK